MHLYVEKQNVAGLTYSEFTGVFGNNTYANPNTIYLAYMGTEGNNVPNRIKIYGSCVINSNAEIKQTGANFITKEII